MPTVKLLAKKIFCHQIFSFPTTNICTSKVTGRKKTHNSNPIKIFDNKIQLLIIDII